MQISKIEIVGFGKFKDTTFDFTTGLQVVYGVNESGKSTLRAFILGMLFGFPSRRQRLARYEPKQTAQYGGTLEFIVAGETYRLTRLGDQPATLLAVKAQQPQPLSLLAKWLAPYDENSYKQLFTFNQAELTALKTLSAQDLNLQLQQAGTRGSAAWRETAAALRQTADSLYKPRGRKPALNEALQQYQTLKQHLQTAQQRYPEYQQLQTTIEQLAAKKSQLTRQLAGWTDQQQQLANLRNQWPVYQQLLQLQTTQDTMTQLPAAVSQRFTQLSKTKTDLQHSLASARQQLTEQPVDAESKGIVGFYVTHQDQFDQLEAKLPMLQQNLGRYQVLDSQVTAAKKQYDGQLAAHPELNASLSPNRQAAVANLKATLAKRTMVTESRRQEQPAANQGKIAGIDWRLMVGGIGLVAGVILPLGGFKWLLMLAGLGLLGWFGWEQLSGSVPTKPQSETSDLAEKLVAAGFSPDLDVNGAQTQLTRLMALQQAQAALTTAEQQLAAQAATVWQALSAYQFAADWLPLNEQQLASSVKRVTEFYETMRQKRQTEQLSGADFAYTQRQVKQLTIQSHTINDQLQELASSAGYATTDELAAAVTAQATVTKNASSLEQLTAQLSATELSNLRQYESLTDLQAAITDTRQAIASGQSQLTQQSAALVTAQTQLKRLTEDGRYTALRQEQANQQTKITVMARQWVTRQLGATWIEQALRELTNQQLPTILTQATTYFAQLTGQRYNEIKLVADELKLVTTAGTSFEVAELSTATKEQLYLAIRLALIVSLGSQATLPLMIDDGFVNFDDQRRRVAWDLLKAVSAEHQILYFTNETAALTQLPADKIQQLT